MNLKYDVLKIKNMKNVKNILFYFNHFNQFQSLLDQESNQSSPGRVLVGRGVYFNFASPVFRLDFIG
jgi:hypothetical protein